MILKEQLNDSSPQSATTQRDMIVPPVHENNTSNGSRNLMDNNQKDGLFIAKVRRFITSNIPISSFKPGHTAQKSDRYYRTSFPPIFSILAQLITPKWECAYTSHVCMYVCMYV